MRKENYRQTFLINIGYKRPQQNTNKPKSISIQGYFYTVIKWDLSEEHKVDLTT